MDALSLYPFFFWVFCLVQSGSLDLIGLCSSAIILCVIYDFSMINFFFLYGFAAGAVLYKTNKKFITLGG